MLLRPRDCLNHYHLIFLASFISLSLALIIIGGTVSGWCIRYGEKFECHSLLNSIRPFSCYFKLIPMNIIICLIVSLFMLIILIIGQLRVENIGIAKREYQLVARFVVIVSLSLAIILIMTVLLVWFHPPPNTKKEFFLHLLSNQTSKNSTDNQESVNVIKMPLDHPAYLKVIGAQRQSMTEYHQILHHGPNLFFSSFIILFFALLIFIFAHRMSH